MHNIRCLFSIQIFNFPFFHVLFIHGYRHGLFGRINGGGNFLVRGALHGLSPSSRTTFRGRLHDDLFKDINAKGFLFLLHAAVEQGNVGAQFRRLRRFANILAKIAESVLVWCCYRNCHD